MKVLASVARCQRTPPLTAKLKGFRFRYFALLTQREQPVQSYRLQLWNDPITSVSSRAKNSPLHPRRSCFAPIKADCEATSYRRSKVIGFRLRPSRAVADWRQSALVEAPGTAPGSEWFIARAVYHHSLPPCGDEQS